MATISIFYAHSGEVIQIDPTAFTSVDDLKNFISERIKVSVPNLILTTVKGSLVKLPALSTEKELFLYSRHYIVPSPTVSAPTFPVPGLSKPQSPPDRLDDHNDLNSWRTLYANRVTWASSVLAHADRLSKAIDEINSNVIIMQRSVAVAASNLDTHVKTAVNNYEDLKGWAFETLKDQEKLLLGWAPALQRLDKLHVKSSVVNNVKDGKGGMTGHKRSKSNNTMKAEQTLKDFVEAEEVEKAGKDLENVASSFERKITQLGSSVETIRILTVTLSEEMEAGKKDNIDLNSNETQYLLSDISAAVQKIQQDHDHISSLANTVKSLALASKTAQVHTKNLLPSLTEMILEMSKIHQAEMQRKNNVSQLCVQHLQGISQIEQQLYRDLTSAIKKCENDFEKDSSRAYQLLTLVVHLPSIYSTFLVECVRRKEWNDRMRNDGTQLAEELAGLREEEEKRRKRWYKMTTQGGELSVDFLPVESNTGGIILDLNLVPESPEWPDVLRGELDSLLTNLKGVDGLESVAKDLAQQMIDLDKPSRRQQRAMTPTLATRAFKMGSIHEAALASSSLFKNGIEKDDATLLKKLQADRSKWDDRAKMYESRIRKLEDLLHRQRSGGTAGGVQFNQINPTTVSSPLTAEPMSRTNSQGANGVSSAARDRRSSLSETAEKQYLTRISMLEKNLSDERETTTQMQQDAQKWEESEKDLNRRVTEADQTKNDLMANLEAKQLEFNDERNVLQAQLRDLEEQLDSWKQRVDEVYIEFDRLEESKLGETERKEKAEDGVLALKTQLEQAQAHSSKQEEQAITAELEFKRANSELRETISKLKEEITQLREDDTSKVSRVSTLEKELNDERETNTQHQSTIASLEAEITEQQQTIESERYSHINVIDDQLYKLQQLKKIYSLLQDSVSNKERSMVTSQSAENFDTMVEKIVLLAEEFKANSKDLKKQSNTGEVALQQLQRENNALNSRLELRTLKARDLTQRLYTHYVRAGHLLESLGFTVIIRDRMSQIVRTSKSSGQDSADLGRSVSMSMSLPLQKSILSGEASSQDVKHLYWMEAEDSELESEKYNEYLKSISAFDMDAFSEAVLKRVKEIEHMARLRQKQARDYRDKYHRMQSEASEKIAFRSFKEGDLAMFLPTRNQVTRPWAAFNIGAPHYFLREQDSHKLQARDWLVARINRVEERIVDLSRSTVSTPTSNSADRASVNSSEGGIDEENPFQLSDGLRWYLLDATEEKPGAPTTPGLGSSTVASANVDARGSLRNRKPVVGAKKTLSKSLQQSIGLAGSTTATAGGDASSLRSRNSLTSLGRKDSGNSGGGGGGGGGGGHSHNNSGGSLPRPTPAITGLPDGTAVVETNSPIG